MSYLRPMDSSPLTWWLSDSLSDQQIKRELSDVVAVTRLVGKAVRESTEPTFTLVIIGTHVIVTVGVNSDTEKMFAAYANARKQPRKTTIIGLDLQTQPNN